MLLAGRHNVTLDDKKRMALPAKLRRGVIEECGSQLIVTRHHQQDCLLIYTPQNWAKVSEQFEQVGFADQAAQDVQFFLIGHMEELKVDKQGRTLIPQLLREDVGLDSEIVLIGLGMNMQVWSKENFEKRFNAALSANKRKSADELQGSALQTMKF